MKKVVIQGIQLFFVIMFLVLIGSILFTPTISFFKLNKFLVLLLAILLFLFFLFFYRWLKARDFSDHISLVILAMLFLVFLLLQLCACYYLRVNPTWDFGSVFNGASNYALNGDIGPISCYLGDFPNNIALFSILVILFKIALFLGITDLFAVGIIWNCIMIDLTVIFLVYFIRKKTGNANAILCALLCLFVAPLYLYSPIFYTDTLTLIFPIFCIYLYDQLKNKFSIWKILLLGLSIVIGMKIKMTVVIVLIAIIMDFILHYDRKKWGVPVGILILSVVCFLGFYRLPENFVYEKVGIDRSLKIPYTHWIMMGMAEDGGYNASDYAFTYSFTSTEEKMDANIREIKQRLNQFGPFGYLDFLRHKLQFTWEDGTYYSAEKLHREPMNTNSFLYQLTARDGEYFIYFQYFMNSLQFMLIALLTFGCFWEWKTKRSDHFVFYLSILGVTSFLLFWESRSRYLVNMIPVILYFVVLSFQFIDCYLKSKKIDA